MSKIKSDIIQKFYKDQYNCKKGHNVIWKGREHIYAGELICDKCGGKNKFENPIRWSCKLCNTYYCTKCYDLSTDKFCPEGHKYNFYKQQYFDSSSTFTCDKCSKEYKHIDGVIVDKECNVTICPKCFCNSCDIPDVLED